MSDVLQDFTTTALVTAIRANMMAWYRYVGSSAAAERHESPEVTWLLTGIDHPFPNAVLRTRVAPDGADGLIERTLAQLQARQANRVSWWVEADSEPADLGQRLIAHGLKYVEGGPGMAADLMALNEDLPMPAGLTIEPVADTEALHKWARTSMIGFGLAETDVDIWFDVFAGLGFDLPLRNYVGILQGEPVATSELLLGEGVAGVYVVATLPAARRLGIGAAVTLAPLRDARALGYRIAILHSSPMGLGVYPRLGFREYCRMSHYAWDGDGTPD